MGIPFYLAMTASEFACADHIPEDTAWMACHFSPYGTGLTNIPTQLPSGSLLILNDRTPIHGHDPERIRKTLEESLTEWNCSGVLLDFQRPGYGETTALVKSLTDSLPCPVCVSEAYAAELSCPVFLPPVPLLKTLDEYLSPWPNREIWLELALDSAIITITETENTIAPLPPFADCQCPHADMQLFCHYGIELDAKQAIFTLKRAKSDLQNLMIAAEKWGVSRFIGLWQECRS